MRKNEILLKKLKNVREQLDVIVMEHYGDNVYLKEDLIEDAKNFIPNFTRQFNLAKNKIASATEKGTKSLDNFLKKAVSFGTSQRKRLTKNIDDFKRDAPAVLKKRWELFSNTIKKVYDETPKYISENYQSAKKQSKEFYGNVLNYTDEAKNHNNTVQFIKTQKTIKPILSKIVKDRKQLVNAQKKIEKLENQLSELMVKVDGKSKQTLVKVQKNLNQYKLKISEETAKITKTQIAIGSNALKNQTSKAIDAFKAKNKSILKNVKDSNSELRKMAQRNEKAFNKLKNLQNKIISFKTKALNVLNKPSTWYIAAGAVVLMGIFAAVLYMIIADLSAIGKVFNSMINSVSSAIGKVSSNFSKGNYVTGMVSLVGVLLSPLSAMAAGYAALPAIGKVAVGGSILVGGLLASVGGLIEAGLFDPKKVGNDFINKHFSQVKQSL